MIPIPYYSLFFIFFIFFYFLFSFICRATHGWHAHPDSSGATGRSGRWWKASPMDNHGQASITCESQHHQQHTLSHSSRNLPDGASSMGHRLQISIPPPTQPHSGPAPCGQPEVQNAGTGQCGLLNPGLSILCKLLQPPARR